MIEGEKSCFSHFGEDQVLTFMLRNIKTGFYFDIGCFHPSMFSNTMSFYKQNWRGVLVDPNPFMIQLCREQRPGDVTTQVAVSDYNGKSEFFIFHDWASSNTIDPVFRDQIASGQNISVREAIIVDVLTLKDLFETYLPKGRQLDLVNIDIENIDYRALSSNDWITYRPKVIAIEDLVLDFDHLAGSNIHQLMFERDYQLYSRCVYTSIYFDRHARSILEI